MRWLLALIMAAIAFVQADGAYAATPGTPYYDSPALSVTSGNALIVTVRSFTNTCTGVTDTAGNTYTSVGFVDNSNDKLEVFLATNITGHASNVARASFALNITFVSVVVAEYTSIGSSLGELDDKSNSGVTTITSDSFSTSEPHSLVFVAFEVANATGSWSGVSSGYTLRDQDPSGVTGIADRITTTLLTGETVTATHTTTSAKALVVIGFSSDTPSLPGTQPSIPSAIPLVFAQITIGGTVYNAAETPLADASTYYDGYKPPILLRVSPITRELARDGYRTMSFSIEVSDVDRTFRGLAASSTIYGSYVRVFIVDDAVRRAEGLPFQIAAGYVVDFEATDPFTFTFHVEDVLGRFFSEIRREALMPSHVLTVAEFAGMDPSFDGRASPLVIGTCVKADYGVVPGIFMGEINLRSLHPSAINKDVYVLLFSEGAMDDQVNFYYNPPTWKDAEAVSLGDIIRPTPDNASGFVYVCTTAGTTGGTEPTWPTSGTVNDNGVVWTTSSLDDGTLRYVVPDSAFSATGPCFAPHKPNWSTATGLSTQYVDYGGRRYGGLLFLDKTHRYAEPLKANRITVTADLSGHAVSADGSGGVITKPGAVIQHLVKNCILGESNWITYLSAPTFDGTTSVIDAASFTTMDAVHAARISGGYLVGRVEGRRGEQMTAFDSLREIQEGCDVDLGVNRLGQLMASMEDTTAAATVTYNGLDDIISLQAKPNKDDYANRVNFRYGYRYTDPVPDASPKEGNPTSVLIGGQARGDWESGEQILMNGAAITAVGRTQAYEFDNYAVRDPATAGNVALAYLNRRVGPPASLDGERQFTLTTGLTGLGKTTNIVELGSVIAITHPEGLDTSGWTDWRGRVTTITVDPMACRVTLAGPIYSEQVQVLSVAVSQAAVTSGGSVGVIGDAASAGAAAAAVDVPIPDVTYPATG